MSGTQENRRKIIMINKRFQLALIIKFLLVNVAILILFGVFLYFFFDSEIEANLNSAHVIYQNMKEMLLPIILTLSVLNILISSIVITLFVLSASLRIAGPLYRFNTAINEIAKGNLKPLLKLREYDELYAMAESLQEMAEYFINRSSKSRQITAEMLIINEKIKNPELGAKIEELNTLLNELNY